MILLYSWYNNVNENFESTQNSVLQQTGHFGVSEDTISLKVNELSEPYCYIAFKYKKYCAILLNIFSFAI